LDKYFINFKCYSFLANLAAISLFSCKKEMPTGSQAAFEINLKSQSGQIFNVKNVNKQCLQWPDVEVSCPNFLNKPRAQLAGVIVL